MTKPSRGQNLRSVIEAQPRPVSVAQRIPTLTLIASNNTSRLANGPESIVSKKERRPEERNQEAEQKKKGRPESLNNVFTSSSLY